MTIDLMSQRRGSSDSDIYDYLSESFEKYLQHEGLMCLRLGNAFQVQIIDDDQLNVLDYEFRDLTQKVMRHAGLMLGKCLLQIWRAEEVISDENTDESQFRLTTRNQPFIFTGVSNIVESIHCGFFPYICKMRDVIITGDGYGGAIGRAFQNKMMELSPDISYYSNQEFPQREIFLSCNIKWLLAIPMLDKFGHAVGVVELVTQVEPYLFELCRFPTFRRCEVTCLACYKYEYFTAKECGVPHFNKNKHLALRNVLTEIGWLINQLSVGHGIKYSQTWMLCRHCNSLFLSNKVIVYGMELHQSEEEDLMEATSKCILRKGETIVGKAATSSNNLVYCEDVSKFSIVEHPYVHLTRVRNFSACFAISLQLNYTGDQVYVLEFFLESSHVKHHDLKATLVPVLESIRELLQICEFFSGEELSKSLSVQVVENGFPDRYETLDLGRLDPTDNHMSEMNFIENVIEERDVARASLEKQDTNAQTFSVEPEGELQQIITLDPGRLDPTDNHMSEMNFIENLIEERDVASASLEKQDTNAQTFSVEPEGELPSITHQRGGIDISKKDLLIVRDLKRVDAAKKLNVSISTFKRICRHYGIFRWPPRKININHLSFGNTAQASSPEEFRDSSPTAHDENLVKVKAKYGNIFIKFQLSVSSGIVKFHEEVWKRLKLEVGKYSVKYKDEDNDWILVACDDDLRDYTTNSTILEKNTLEIVTEHI